MGPEFIVRVQKMTAGLAVLAALFVSVYLSPAKAGALLAGAAWALANVDLLRRLVAAVFRPEGPKRMRALALLAVKFPALYAVGYALLAWVHVDPIWALLGFSLWMTVLFLKALGRLLVWSGWFERMPADGHVGAPARPWPRSRRPGRSSRAAALGAVVVTLAVVAAIAAGGGSAETRGREVAGPTPASASIEPGSDAQGAVAQNAVEPGSAGHTEAAATVGAAEHGAGGASHEETVEQEEEANELPNLISVLHVYFRHSPVVRALHHWENLVFSLFIALIIIVVFAIGMRPRKMVPGRFQCLLEMAVEGLAGFIEGILGPGGREFVPFLGTLFLYIFIMNIAGLVPGLKSPTSSLNVTAGLAITVFLYVQYTGIRKNGLGGYIYHLMGSPKGITWAMVPLNIPLHIIEELARPMSLALRLFGNITGEDVLIFIFATLGVASLSFLHVPVGLPLQIPFIFLALLTSTIQALVFTLLSVIYFSLMLPHGEEHEASH